MEEWEEEAATWRLFLLSFSLTSHTHAHIYTKKRSHTNLNRTIHYSQLRWSFSHGGWSTVTSCDQNKSFVTNKVVLLLYNLFSNTMVTFCDHDKSHMSYSTILNASVWITGINNLNLIGPNGTLEAHSTNRKLV